MDDDMERPRSPFERLELNRLPAIMGLSIDQADNLMNLVLLHALLDTVLSAKLAVVLVNDVERVARKHFPERLTLAMNAGVLSREQAAAIERLNKVRNEALHYKPRQPFRLIEAIHSNAVFARVYDDAFAALRHLMRDV